MNLRDIDLDKLNSMTKYPSIPTMHRMDDRGLLLDERLVVFEPGEPVEVTEKIDGACTRIVFVPDHTASTRDTIDRFVHELSSGTVTRYAPDGSVVTDPRPIDLFDTGRLEAYRMCQRLLGLHRRSASYVIGSREEFLHARGDVIANAAHGIVEIVRPYAERVCDAFKFTSVVVLYGEAYGGPMIGKSRKAYTGGDDTLVGFRLFDMAVFPWNLDWEMFVHERRIERGIGFEPMREDEAVSTGGDYDPVLINLLYRMTRETIAKWRDGGGQPFIARDGKLATLLQEYARAAGAQWVPKIEASAPPPGIGATYEWLQEILAGPTRAGLVQHGGWIHGRGEGVVVRTPDRKKIAKIRFEDYERTRRKR